MKTLRRTLSRAHPENLPRLPADQRFLARQAPVITAEAAVAAQHAMARHDERDGIASDRRSDRARSAWPAEVAGDIRIADGGPHGDPEQGLPDPDFKVRADQ